MALEGNNGSRVYYADGTVEELPKEGEIYIKDEIATSAIHGTLNEVFCGDIQQQARGKMGNFGSDPWRSSSGSSRI